MSPSDHDLLRDYAHDGSQSAFATLVERHLNLVYSAARRQVRSPQLAEEAAQAVFVDLARHASRFDAGTPLVAWLHVVTRRTAIDLVRRESRRAAREQQAAEIESMKPDATHWSAVEPLLDEAVESLDATDRTAVLLRYFENKSLREVGAALGTTDDAAQKRVSRALERLRDFFLQRGVTVTAAGLATDLSAHTLQMAPAGLGPAISTATAALSSVVNSAATLEATKTIAMTTLQKSLVAATFVLVVGAGLYEARVFAQQSTALDTLNSDVARAETEIRALHATRADAAAKLAAVEQRIDARLAQNTPVSAADAALESQMQVWFAQVDRLKAFLAQRSELNIPELQLLSDQDWFWAVATSGPQLIENDSDARKASARLRRSAENRFASRLSTALNAYLKANDGALPDNLHAVATFADPPLDAAMLDRYEISVTGKLSDLSREQRSQFITEKAPADPELDGFWFVSATGGFGSTSALSQNLRDAQRAFANANRGERATTAVQLMPFVRWPVSEAALQRLMGPSPNSP